MTIDQGELAGLHHWPFGDLRPGAYPVILVDPPWKFVTYSAKGLKKSPDAHYQTMKMRDIKLLPVSRLAAQDCALVLWTTGTMLRRAMQVLDCWGFEYKTMGAWVKMTNDGTRPAFGTGYIMRNCIEPFLIATRGHPKRKARNERDAILSPRREHSRKPEDIRRKVMALWDGPYLELFAREGVPGWEAWGLEKDKFSESPEMPVKSESEVLAGEGDCPSDFAGAVSDFAGATPTYPPDFADQANKGSLITS